MTTECPREPEVLDALASGRWPDEAPGDLRAHVSSCTVCGDLALVAGALRTDYDRARAAADVPPAGRVWWRAEVRARREAAHKAAQPITLMLGLAGACAVGLAIAALQLGWPLLFHSVGTVGAVLDAAWSGIVVFSTAAPSLVWMLAVAVVLSIIITPLALYFAFSDD